MIQSISDENKNETKKKQRINRRYALDISDSV